MEHELGLKSSVQSKKVDLSTPGEDSDAEDDDRLEDDLDIQQYDDQEEVVVNEEDDLAITKFMNRNEKRRTLAEIIQEKITEKKTEILTQFSDAGSEQLKDLNPKVNIAAVYHRSFTNPRIISQILRLSKCTRR